MEKSFITLLKENWLIIGFVGQFILTFGFLQTTVHENKLRIEKLESTKVQDALNIAEINSRLSSIETSLIFIRESLK